MRIRVAQTMYSDLCDIVTRRDMVATTISDVFCRALRKWWRMELVQRGNVEYYVAHAKNGDCATLDVPLNLNVPETLQAHLTASQMRDIVRWYIDAQIAAAKTAPFETSAVAGKDYLITE